MQDFGAAFVLAAQLLLRADPGLLEIIGLSLKVSLTATVLSCLMGMPLGALLAAMRFPGRQALLVLVNALMGLPPVVVGLMVYLMLSRAGPLGWLQLLYTPTAMIIAQTLLITPIVAALTRQLLEELHREYAEQFRSFCLSRRAVIATLLWDGRHGLVTVALALALGFVLMLQALFVNALAMGVRWSRWGATHG